MSVGRGRLVVLIDTPVAHNKSIFAGLLDEAVEAPEELLGTFAGSINIGNATEVVSSLLLLVPLLLM